MIISLHDFTRLPNKQTLVDEVKALKHPFQHGCRLRPARSFLRVKLLVIHPINDAKLHYCRY